MVDAPLHLDAERIAEQQAPQAAEEDRNDDGETEEHNGRKDYVTKSPWSWVPPGRKTLPYTHSRSRP